MEFGMTVKTYDVIYVCMNCETGKTVKIPFGQWIPQIGEDGITGTPYREMVCDYCGCNNFRNGKTPKDFGLKEVF
jgi:hypothetical protein